LTSAERAARASWVCAVGPRRGERGVGGGGGRRRGGGEAEGTGGTVAAPFGDPPRRGEKREVEQRISQGAEPMPGGATRGPRWVRGWKGCFPRMGRG
jgi:hypothetical protein